VARRRPSCGRRDVHARHHLDAGCNGSRHVGRQPLDFDEPPINPETDDKSTGERLDMNVRSAAVGGACQQPLDRSNRRRVGGAVQRRPQVNVAILLPRQIDNGTSHCVAAIL
jgi:hypothetical protein